MDATGWLFVLLAALVLAAGFGARRRMRDTRRGRRPVVTDEVLRRILEEGEGELETGDAEDEPLDEDQIRDAEDRFWDESEWDEPEEFGR